MLSTLLAWGWLDRLAQTLGTDARTIARGAGRVVAIWLLAWVALVVVKVVAHRIERAVDDGNDAVTTAREKRGRTLSALLRSAGKIVIVAIAFLLTVNVFVDIGPVLGGLGILGLAVSFGAQSLVKDVLSGFFILLEDQFAVGDVIEVGDAVAGAGKSGVVEKMTLRIVVLRDVRGAIHIIPNGEIKVVSNMTRGWARAVIDVGVAYEADVDRALAVVRDEAAKFSSDPQWNTRLEGALEVPGVESLGDSSVVVRVLARTVPGAQWDAAREFRRRIKKRLDAEGIDIPFPQRTVHVKVTGPADPTVAAGAAGGA